MSDTTSLPAFSLASALLLTTLVALTLAMGASQQTFEWFLPPDAYGAALLREAVPIRVIVGVDDLFIAAYVTTTVLLAMRLAGDRWSPLHVLVVVFGVAAGLLDLQENHHLLTMLRMAESAQPIPVDQILDRSVWSQVKWMLGHLAFVLVGVVFPARDLLARGFRASLIAVQLPLGALAWAAPAGTPAILWLRYVSLIAGFAAVAWMSRRSVPSHAGGDGVARGVPA